MTADLPARRQAVFSLLVAAAALLTTACGSTAASARVEPAAAAAEKPQAPVDLTVATIPAARLGRPFAIVVTATPRGPATTLAITGAFAGAVTHAGRRAPSAVWRDVPRAAARRRSIDVFCRRAGHGTVTITARVVTGGVAQTRVAVVDVLAHDDEVLAGTNGLQQLQLAHLDHELARGRISRAQYDQQRARLLGGGATERSG